MLLNLILTCILFVFCIFLLLVKVLCYPSKTSSKQFVAAINKIPGPKGFPLLGCGWEFYVAHDQVLPLLKKYTDTYDSPFRAWVLGRAYVAIKDPEDCEVLLGNTKCLEKSCEYKYLQNWVGLGLLTSTGERWHTHRKILTPAFHFKILEQFVQVFVDNSDIMINQLAGKLDHDWVDINSFVTLCSLDIICESTMGTSVNAQVGDGGVYCSLVKRLSAVIHHRGLQCFLWNNWMYKLSPSYWEEKKILKNIHAFTEKVIRERKAEYRALGPVAQTEETFTRKRRLAFLDLLIEVAEKEGTLSDRDIREQVDTFMFEGHDTVSSAISWCLYLLGANQDIQEKAVEELQGIFGDSDRAATYNDLQNMKYLEQVIKEALRLYPSVPMYGRELTVDIQIKQYTIPAGAQIGLMPFLIHRDPKYYPDPEKFDPERFSPANVQRRHPFAYLPFSAGPRNCIGQRFAVLEEKTVISTVLRNFKLHSLDKREDLKPLLELILRPKNGLRIKLSPRIM